MKIRQVLVALIALLPLMLHAADALKVKSYKAEFRYPGPPQFRDAQNTKLTDGVTDKFKTIVTWPHNRKQKSINIILDLDNESEIESIKLNLFRYKKNLESYNLKHIDVFAAAKDGSWNAVFTEKAPENDSKQFSEMTIQLPKTKTKRIKLVLKGSKSLGLTEIRIFGKVLERSADST